LLEAAGGVARLVGQRGGRRAGLLSDGLAPVADALVEPLLEQREGEVGLALEVVVDRAVGEAGLVGDLLDAGARKPRSPNTLPGGP
jgi:hypothetical protein